MISIEEVRRADELLDQGWSRRRVARELGISETTVDQIRALRRGGMTSCVGVPRCELCRAKLAPCRRCTARFREGESERILGQS